MNDVLKPSEVAKILRVDSSTVKRWIQQGALEAVALPQSGKLVQQKYRIKRETIEKLIEGAL